MCRTCWEQRGSPQLDNQLVRDITCVIERLYEVASTGGNLHIIFDDWNLSDVDIVQCEKFVRIQGADTLAQKIYERACISFLKEMSVEERGSALALFEGFWS